MAEQRRVVFSGTVQGVGFRWTTQRTAERFAIAGWVRNRPDGDVELVAEGESGELDAFLDSLRNAMAGYIRDESCQTAPASGRFDGFAIRH